jgi:YidC/Oxa1 family membrane protein insertase
VIAEVQIWQSILDGLGWFLAKIYDVIPNYGVTIILFTVVIRLFLLPLGIRQIRAMHAMQRLQPKIKQIQQKHKGNRQKQQEEMMKLYQEHGVNPLGSCLPLLLQAPVFLALFSVLRPPVPGVDVHIPEDTALYEAVAVPPYSGAEFLGMNLMCPPIATVNPDAQRIKDPETEKVAVTLDCGTGFPAAVPYFAALLVMAGTMYYQSRQMQRASPQAANKQQQMIARAMPLVFGVFGVNFPAGLIVYWTTSNLWQIGQQHVLLGRLHAEAEKADARRASELPARGSKKAGRKGEAARGVDKPKAKPASAEPAGERSGAKKGFLQRMLESAEQERERRLKQEETKKTGGGSGNRKKRPKR